MLSNKKLKILENNEFEDPSSILNGIKKLFESPIFIYR
jgi:hypothetical protein